MINEIKVSNKNPGFFFLLLGVVITLITTVATSLSLFFEVLDKQWPDILTATYSYSYNSYSYESLRSYLAILIIIFPVFLILTYFFARQLKKGLGERATVVLKWAIYLILFLATAVVVIDLVTLVNYFVSGEITERFIYKVLGTGIISALVLIYYWIFLKNLDTVKEKKAKTLTLPNLLGVVSLGLFLTLVVFSFQTVGSPQKQRAYRLDERRVNDLQSLQWSIISYWQNKKALPKALTDLNDPLANFNVPRDPEFQAGKAYTYKVTGDLSFELCATFSQKSPEGYLENSGGAFSPQFKRAVSEPLYVSNSTNESWQHELGEYCFVRKIDPEIYKPIKE